MRAVQPSHYQMFVAVAGTALALIVLTGAAVRLTEAGLGCEDWPACSADRFVPELALHPWIEFGNRLLSGLVALAVGVAVLTAHWRVPYRPDLVRWAWGLVIGVAAQIVVGGITVMVDLHPALVGFHYLLSAVLLWNVTVLWVRARSGGPETEPRVGSSDQWLSRAAVALASIVLLLGTLVTGTGPNSGDSRAERLDLDLTTISRVHSVAAWCLLVAVVVLTWRLHRQAPAVARLGRILVASLLIQGAIGYIQFATGVPPALVALHIAGSVLVWCLVVLLHLHLWERPTIEPSAPAAERAMLESAGELDTIGA